MKVGMNITTNVGIYMIANVGIYMTTNVHMHMTTNVRSHYDECAPIFADVPHFTYFIWGARVALHI